MRKDAAPDRTLEPENGACREWPLVNGLPIWLTELRERRWFRALRTRTRPGDRFISLCLALAVVGVLGPGTRLLAPEPALAHPGNTDAYGGHNCYTNCAYWGVSGYHFHDTPTTPSYDPDDDYGYDPPHVGGIDHADVSPAENRAIDALVDSEFAFKRAQKQQDRAQERIADAQAKMAEASEAAGVLASQRSALEPSLEAITQQADLADDRAENALDAMVADRERALDRVQASQTAFQSRTDVWTQERTLFVVLAALAFAVALMVALRRLLRRRAEKVRRAEGSYVSFAAPVLGVGLAAAGCVALALCLADLIDPTPMLAGIVAIPLAGAIASIEPWLASKGSKRDLGGSGESIRTAAPLLAALSALGAGIALVAVGFSAPRPQEPEFPKSTIRLAAAAEGDPEADPTKRVAMLQAKAEDLAEAEAEVRDEVSDLTAEIDDAEDDYANARQDLKRAESELAKSTRKAEAALADISDWERLIGFDISPVND